MASEAMAEKLDERWRVVCPEGHHGLRKKKGPTVFCEGCNHAYRYEDLVDTKAQGRTEETRIGF